MRLERLQPLGEDESIFSNPDSLEPNFIPPILPYRENETMEIANSMKPLLAGSPGRNLLIIGKAGIGKTHAVKKILGQFREEAGEMHVFYVNCWTNSTGKEVFSEMCSQLKISPPADSTESQLLKRITDRVEEKPVMVCFDEIDKAKEFGFLYSSLERLPVKSVILVSNNPGILGLLDDRIRSRLLPKEISFRPYSREETAGILRERRKYAFYENVWGKQAAEIADRKTFEKSDIRFGIQLLKLAGLKAESEASRTVLEEHVAAALGELSL